MPPRTRYKSTTGKGRTNVGASKSNRPGYGGSNTNSKGVNISPPSKSNNTSKSSKDISKEIDKAMSDRQDQRNQQDQGIMAKIGLGDIEKSYIGDDVFKETVPAGQHKLRTQYDRLLAKYGDDFAETSQAKVLANYLSGVPQEQGGGLGAFDPTYGGATDIDPESEEYRQMLLDSITGPNAGVPVVADYNEGIQQFLNMRNEGTYDRELAQGNLNANQFQNFMRQMKAADPSIGNQAYNKAFPDFGETLGKLIMPAVGAVAGIPGLGFLSNLNKGPQIESQIYGPSNKIFYDTSVPREDRSGIMGTQMAQQTGTTDPGYDMSIYGSRIGKEGPFTADFVDQDGDGSDDRYQSGPGQGGSKAIPKEKFIGGIGIDKLGGVPSLTPTTIDYASMGPQYGGYVNQGISDPRFASYFQNLNLFPRRS